MSYVIVDKNAPYYTDSTCQRGTTIGDVCRDESPRFRITKQKNGMYHLSGQYGDLGWVYRSAIRKFL